MASEICSDCGQTKPIKQVLKNPTTGEERKQCQVCATRWLLSDEEFPLRRRKESKTPISTIPQTA